MNESEEASLLGLSQQRFDQFVSKIPSSVLRSLKGPLTWTEARDGQELFFSVKVLESSADEIHLAVSMTTPGRSVDPLTGSLNIEISTSFVIGV